MRFQQDKVAPHYPAKNYGQVLDSEIGLIQKLYKNSEEFVWLCPRIIRTTNVDSRQSPISSGIYQESGT